MRAINIDALRKAASGSLNTKEISPGRLFNTLKDAGIDPAKWYESVRPHPREPSEQEPPGIEMMIQYGISFDLYDDAGRRERFPEVVAYIESIALEDSNDGQEETNDTRRGGR